MSCVTIPITMMRTTDHKNNPRKSSMSPAVKRKYGSKSPKSTRICLTTKTTQIWWSDKVLPSPLRRSPQTLSNFLKVGIKGNIMTFLMKCMTVKKHLMPCSKKERRRRCLQPSQWLKKRQQRFNLKPMMVRTPATSRLFSASGTSETAGVPLISARSPMVRKS